VGVSELALNDYERNAFVRHLDRVRVAQLMRREPAPVAGDRRVPVLYPPAPQDPALDLNPLQIPSGRCPARTGDLLLVRQAL
jgi:hypothetical protein